MTPLCRHLRWKERYGVRFANDEELWTSLLGSATPMSCLRTCSFTGPDDQLVSPEGCAPDRSCFEPSAPRTS